MNANDDRRGRRILIVDDNPAIHEDYKKILAVESGSSDLDDLSAFMFGEEQATPDLPQYELQSAFQGQDALEMVQQAVEHQRPYLMAFVDMRMPPGWDGLKTIEELWNVDPRLQVVVCSAYSDYSWSEMIQRVAHRDRFLILKKPFDNIEVCQMAIALTQKWQLERMAEERMVSIVETAADGIITFRDDGTIESCNGASCELLGYERADLLGHNFAKLFAGSECPSADELVGGSTDHLGRVRSRAREMIGLRKDGNEVPLLVSLSQFSAEDGRRYTAILRDLTEYKQLQANLAQAQKLESIGQLAAGIAHEINTPMQFISQNIEFLDRCTQKLRNVMDAYEKNLLPSNEARSWDDRWTELNEVMQNNRFDVIRDELPRAIQESLEGVARVVSIVRAMREVSHPGRDEFVDIDLNSAIESSVTITRNRWKYSAEVACDLDPELSCLRGNAGNINQLIVNLIVNAADATAEKFGENPEQRGTITVRTVQEREHAVIQVEDNGCGIPEDIQERIFDPFFTTKDVGKGTGQGLALAYNIVVKRHQGTIEVDSTPGVGAIFTVRLPWERDVQTEVADKVASVAINAPVVLTS